MNYVSVGNLYYVYGVSIYIGLTSLSGKTESSKNAFLADITVWFKMTETIGQKYLILIMNEQFNRFIGLFHRYSKCFLRDWAFSHTHVQYSTHLLLSHG